MASGRILIVVELNDPLPPSGSAAPDLGHKAYWLKKEIEKLDELGGTVIGVETSMDLAS